MNQNILTTLVEFFGIALGPLHEVTLYRLNDDNTGVAVQVELNHITSTAVGDPLPQDIVNILNLNHLHSSNYLVGLTAHYGHNRTGNLGLLYICDESLDSNYLLTLLLDSFDYYEMASRLLRISNLNSKMEIVPFATTQGSGFHTPIHLNSHSAPAKQEEADNESLYHSTISRIDTIIRDVMGDDVNVQAAYTQEKRIRIVELLCSNEIFKVKGMIRVVARQLYCSEATIYRYLSYISK